VKKPISKSQIFVVSPNSTERLRVYKSLFKTLWMTDGLPSEFTSGHLCFGKDVSILRV
jgi:hypothetical protein